MTKNEFKSKYENLFIDYKELLDKCLKNKLSPRGAAIPFENFPENLIPSSFHLQSAGDVFLNKENKTCLTYLNGIKGLKANFQELLFDNVGKYACFAYKKIKEKNRVLEEKIRVAEENQRKIIEHHMKIYERTLKYHEKYIDFKEKFKTINGYKGLSDEDLKDLSETLNKALDNAKQEQIHRLYRKQINQLKTQLNQPASPEKPKKEAKNRPLLSLAKESEKIHEFLSKNTERTQNPLAATFDFEDFEANFLHNPLDLSFIFEKNRLVGETQKSPIHQKPPLTVPVLQAKQNEKPPEKTEKISRESSLCVENSRKHKKTRSLVPVVKNKAKSIINKPTKRPSSVEKSQTLSISTKKSEEKSQDIAKLKELIEDKKILAETFVLNKPPRAPEDPANEKIEKKSLANFKEDAENLKILVRKVSNTVNENMDGIQSKMNKCQITDFFSEQDFFSNHEEFIGHNLLESAEKGEKLDFSNGQISILNMTEDLGNKMKKRRSRAERNEVRKIE